MHWADLPLRIGGAPALLDNRWLINVASSAEADVGHRLDVRLNIAVPPTVPVDFLQIIWRMGCRGEQRISFHAAALRQEDDSRPPSTTLAAAFTEVFPAVFRADDGDRDVTFQLQVRQVWRPRPSN